MKPFWRWLLRKPRFQAVIVGMESKNVSDLPFVQFRTEEQAIEWVLKMNGKVNPRDMPLTMYGYEEIQ